jgi:hypothetical protein
MTSSATVQEFLKITSEELHRPVRKKFRMSSIWVDKPYKIWSADLAEFTEAAANARYVLVAVDVGSRLAYATPLHNKSAEEVAAGFKRLFKEAGGKPEKIWVDQGKEFWNKDVQKLVETYSSFGNSKSVLAERFIKTLRERVWRRFDAENTRDLAKLLPEIMREYNEKKLAMGRPKEKKQGEKDKYKAIQVFELGDTVRIARTKGRFEKEAYANWSRELFTVVQASYYPKDNLWKYKVKDQSGEEIAGEFYEPELQPSALGASPFAGREKNEQKEESKDEPIYLVEEVLQRKNGKVLVKWLGYDKKFNSWIPESDIVADLDGKPLPGESVRQPDQKPIKAEERKRPTRRPAKDKKEKLVEAKPIEAEEKKRSTREEAPQATRRSARVAARKK